MGVNFVVVGASSSFSSGMYCVETVYTKSETFTNGSAIENFESTEQIELKTERNCHQTLF